MSYRPLLTAKERWRYEEANRLSRNYRRLDRFLEDLRYTYRLGSEAKLQRFGRRREMLRAG